MGKLGKAIVIIGIVILFGYSYTVYYVSKDESNVLEEEITNESNGTSDTGESFDDWLNSIQGSWTEVTDSNVKRILTIDGNHVNVNEMKDGLVIGNRTNCTCEQDAQSGQNVLVCTSYGWDVKVYALDEGLILETSGTSYYYTRSGK